MTRYEIFTLENANGLKLRACNLGAIITEFHIPDRNGQLADIVLGYDDIEDYARDTSHMGAVAGRFAGRIAQGKCTVKGKKIQLNRNHGPHHLHGGHNGFNRKLCRTDIKDAQTICFDLTSPDGDEGYPGRLELKVTYGLKDDNSLHITYEATTSKRTIINLTQHSYFNLSGRASALDDHCLTIYADQVLEFDEEMIPTGKILDVQDTPLDFRRNKELTGRLDHSFILARQQNQKRRRAACLSHLPSGRTMGIFTDQPAIQIYTANHLTDDIPGKSNAHYGPRQAVCLETQNFPDAPNHPHFPSAILQAGDIYHSQTIFRCGVKQETNTHE